MSILSLSNLWKTFPGGQCAVAGANLDVEEGEFVTLLGPSGCGKTTTLRCIAGLERPDSGTIVLEGSTVFAKTETMDAYIPPERRGLAMVFQNYALWPHMNVFENVAFGLRERKFSRSDIAAKTEAALRSVQLWHLRDRQIAKLSGGQQQRIALARAIAPDPRVVLFDEPLSNIDAKLRESMRLEILELQRRMGLTAIYVTHDQDEAFSLSSRIVVMNDGRTEQIGTPTEVWNKPASPFVAGFVGSTNRMIGDVMPATGDSDFGQTVAVDAGLQIVLPRAVMRPVGSRVELFVRQADVEVLEDEPRDGGPNVWKAEVSLQTFHGDYALVITQLGAMRIVCRRSKVISADRKFVYLRINPEHVISYVV